MVKINNEQKTYPKEGHKGNFLTSLPKRGQIEGGMVKCQDYS